MFSDIHRTLGRFWSTFVENICNRVVNAAIYMSRGSVWMFFEKKQFFQTNSDTEPKHSRLLFKKYQRLDQIFMLIVQRINLRNRFSPGKKLLFPKKVRIFSIFLGHSVKIFGHVAKCLGILIKACYLPKITVCLNSSFQNFFAGIGHWGNIFNFLVKKFLKRCQNCVLHVKKNVLSKNFSLNF